MKGEKKMRSNISGILKCASALALGLMFVMPTAAVTQYGGNQRRDDQREQRREERREQRREERRGRDWGNNGWGGSQQLRQTALNAGYNNGIKEGRNDQRKGDRFNFTD